MSAIAHHLALKPTGHPFGATAQLTHGGVGQAENLIEVQFQERADKKTAENSKCGQAATAEEEAWEKQANQAHRKVRGPRQSEA